MAKVFNVDTNLQDVKFFLKHSPPNDNSSSPTKKDNDEVGATLETKRCFCQNFSLTKNHGHPSAAGIDENGGALNFSLSSSSTCLC